MKMRTLHTITRVCLLLCLCLGISQNLTAQTDFINTPTSVTTPASTQFTVLVSVNTPSGNVSSDISGASISMTFDTSFLQVVSVTSAAGNLLPTNLPSSTKPLFDNTNGTIFYAAGIFSTTVDPNFPFVEIVFNPLQNTPLTSVDYVIGVVDTDIIDGSFQSVLNTSPPPPSLGVTIADANTPPTFNTNITDQTNNELDVVSLSAAATDESVTLAYSQVGLPGGLTIDPLTGLISGTIEVGASTAGDGGTGVYPVNITVMDDGNPILSASQNFSWTVGTPTIVDYTITATAGANGTISPTSALVAAGGSQIFTITADSGYEVDDVLVNGSTVGAVTSHEITNIQANGTISASFSEIPPFQLCIASGSTALTAFGRNFEEDNADSGPAAHATRTNGKKYAGYGGAIAGTTPGSAEELLFQKEIYGGKLNDANNPPFTYDIPVTNGYYKVELYFAEVFHSLTGKRVFDVLLESNLILDEYEIVDPIKDGIPTFQTAITRTYYVNVQDGSLQVGIGPASVDNGKLSGLCVTAVSSANVHPIASIGNLSFDALAVVAAPLNITDADNDVFSISFSGMPASLTYNPANNQLEGTPTIAEVGTFTVNAIISDGTSSPITEEFEIVINAPAGNDPPTIAALSDVEINAGGTVSVNVQINDDLITDPTASIIIYDKSIPGGTDNPFTPAIAITGYTFTNNGGGSYALSWPTTSTDGRSYEARVSTDDGVNTIVEERFTINVAQNIVGIIPARTFSNPLPWYNGAPQAPFTVLIENNAAQNLGYVDAGDFVEYLIEVPIAGTYDLEFFNGKGNPGPLTITISEENGAGFSVLGTVDANQSGWQTYVSGTTQVTFTNSGIQTLRLDFSGAGGVNIRDFNFTAAGDFAPVIDAIANVEATEGATINIPIQVIDDNDTSASIIIYDKSINTTPVNTNTDPYTSGGTITGYTFEENPVGSGNYTLLFASGILNSRSYFARVTADDGVNPAVTQTFNIDIAHPVSSNATVPSILDATTFANPLPWYGNGPTAPYSVSIENSGTNIGYIEAGEFVEYLIDVPTSGTYEVTFDSANGSGSATGIAIFEEGNATAIGSVTVPNVNWGNYNVLYPTTVTFANSGLQTLRLEFDGGVNTRTISFAPATSNTLPIVTIDGPALKTVAEQGTFQVPIGIGDIDGDNLTVTIITQSNEPQLLQSSNSGTQVDPFPIDASGFMLIDETADGSLGTYNANLDFSPIFGDGGGADGDGSAVYTVTIEVTDGIATVISSFDITVTDVHQFIANDAITRIEAESFDNQGPANTTGDANGIGVEINPTLTNIGFTHVNDYAEYLIDVEQAGTYQFTFAVAKGNAGTATMTVNNGPFIDVVNTTGWQAFIDTIVEVDLLAGQQTLRFDWTAGSSFLFNIDYFDVTLISTDTPPVVTILTPTTNGTPISIVRGTAIDFSAMVTDDEDDNTVLTDALAWSIAPFEPNFAGTGASFTDELFIPGVYTITATSTDSDSNIATDDIEVTILGPVVNFVTPADAAELNTTELVVTWSSQNMFLEGPDNEHFHIWVNPADLNNLDPLGRISTATQPNQQFWNLGSVEGIVEGQNTLVIIAAESGHIEFTNAEAKDIVTFNVTLPVIVPDVVGNTQAAAIIAIEGADLVVGDITNENSATVPLGEVISQDPVSGSLVDTGSTVNFVVSLGAVQVSVPDVVGNTQGDAIIAIEGAGLVVGAVIAVNDAFIPSGTVISQDPIGGSTVDEGSAVDLVVSSGAVQANVPDVVGDTQGDATTAIEGAGLVVGTVTEENSDIVALGDVISQDPIGGSTVDAGSAVNLVVSLGVVQVSVPDVVGNMQAAAIIAIEGADLVVGNITNENSATVPLGEVISQDPVSGSLVDTGSTVNFVVSLGAVQVGVPDVVGNTQPVAETAIVGASLTVGDVTTANSATVGAGDIISQDPAAGSTVDEGSAVSFVVSLGAAQTTVPNVVASTQVVAEAAIVGANLIVGAVTTSNSAIVAAGDVISQNPAGGSTVDQGSAVSFVVSLGAAQVTVPNVVGNTQPVAEAAIVGASLTVGAVTTANSATVPSGSVISQNPISGSLVATGSAVNFVVSLGPLPVGLTQLTVLNANTDTPLFDLVDGMVISKIDIGNTPLGIIYNTSFNPNGVFFTLTGPINESRNEGPAPHSLFGDIGVNILGKPFPVGNYKLVANPVSGPTITVNFSVVDQPAVCASMVVSTQSKTNPTTCGGSGGSITIAVTGATAPFNYSWNHNSSLNAPTASGLTAGQYTVTVTNNEGCSKTHMITLTNPALPAVTLAPFANVLVSTPSFTLSGGLPLGGTYTGQGVTNNTFNPAAVGPGSYPITYSYTNTVTGCSKSATSNLVVTTTTGNTKLTVLNATTDTPLFDLVNNMVIYKSVIGNTPLGIIYNTSFNPNGVFFTLTGPINETRNEGPAPHSLFGDIGIDIQGKPFPVGTYKLVANPVSGPTITVNFTVVNQPSPCASMVASLGSKTNPTTCGGANGSITIAVTGAAAPLSYSWNHNGTLNAATASGLTAGTYTVTVTDANNCSKSVTTTLNDPAKPIVSLANFASILNTAQPIVLTQGSPSGGSYSGTGVNSVAGTFNPAGLLGPIAITYTYTNANGCSNSATKTIVVTSVNNTLSVSKFTLVNADTDADIFDMVAGMTIDMASLTTNNLNIRANTTNGVASVSLVLTGAQAQSRIENAAPYALYGDSAGDYFINNFITGNYVVSATPYSLNGAGGTAGTALTIGFTFTNSASLSAKGVKEMSISPNPADKVANIIFVQPKRVSTIYVYDAVGRLAKIFSGDPGEEVTLKQIPVQDLPAGTYFVRTIDVTGKELQQQMAIKR